MLNYVQVNFSLECKKHKNVGKDVNTGRKMQLGIKVMSILFGVAISHELCLFPCSYLKDDLSVHAPCQSFRSNVSLF